MTKNRWRTIFISIILGTIPCYILGLGLWLFAPNPNAPTPTPSPLPFATFTPLNQDGAPTWTPLGNDNSQPTQNIGNDLILTQFVTVVATTVQQPTFAPIVNTIPPVQPTFAPPSLVPTFFVTSTPTVVPPTSTPIPATNTPVATNTPLPTNTSSAPPEPTATTQILLPPTDTPSP